LVAIGWLAGWCSVFNALSAQIGYIAMSAQEIKPLTDLFKVCYWICVVTCVIVAEDKFI